MFVLLTRCRAGCWSHDWSQFSAARGRRRGQSSRILRHVVDVEILSEQAACCSMNRCAGGAKQPGTRPGASRSKTFGDRIGPSRLTPTRCTSAQKDAPRYSLFNGRIWRDPKVLQTSNSSQPLLSTTFEDEALATVESEATRTDWMADLRGGLGVYPAAGVSTTSTRGGTCRSCVGSPCSGR